MQLRFLIAPFAFLGWLHAVDVDPSTLGKPAIQPADAEAPILSSATTNPTGRKPDAVFTSSVNTAAPVPGSHAADPFISLKAATAYIQSQRGLQGKGLPSTYYVPPGTAFNDTHEQLIVTEGVGLYDTSLALLTLIEAGEFEAAQQIADVYVSGVYSAKAADPLRLAAYPNTDNRHSFDPFDQSTYYFFDFTNVYGSVNRWGHRWDFWSVHTGPNAWLANAFCRLVIEGRRRHVPEAQLTPYLSIADTIGRGILRLQDKDTQGGIRYSPLGAYHAAASADPYVEINSENNLSAYAALQMLYRTTGHASYKEGARRVLRYFKEARVYKEDGQVQLGLMDPEAHTLRMGVALNKTHWELQKGSPTDSGGTWAISALGPAQIDALWGKGAAYRMWERVRAEGGRTADFAYATPTDALAGLDYNNFYPAAESLITPEWTAGGLFALQALLNYYGSQRRSGLTPAQLEGLRADLASSSAFMKTHATAYAYGPGHGGERQGKTGFGWASPPETVDAMASVYLALFLGGAHDPLAYWQRLNASKGP